MVISLYPFWLHLWWLNPILSNEHPWKNSIKLHEKNPLNFIEPHKTSLYKPSKIYEIQ